MTYIMQPLMASHRTDGPGAREKRASAPTDPWETVREYALHPGSGPPTLHTHPVHETVCVTEGVVGVLTVREGKAHQERVPAGSVFIISAHVPHVVTNIGITAARFLTFQPLSPPMSDEP